MTGTATRDWPAYYAAVAGSPPAATLLHSLDRFEREPRPRRGWRAVDLGCGAGRDTVELLRRGWRVLAIDREPAAIKGLQDRPGLPMRRLQTRVQSFDQACWPAVDLVNASFALPFCPPDTFPTVWERIVASLQPGCRFAGHLFGDRDEWASTGETLGQTRGNVEDLLLPFEVELLRDVEHDGHTARGAPHHWHVFHIVARRTQG